MNEPSSFMQTKIKLPNWVFLIGILMFLSQKAFSQDTLKSVHFNPIKVTDASYFKADTAFIALKNSISQFAVNVTEVLSYNSFINIRRYSNAGLASFSVRGFGTNQNLTVWSNLPLVNNTNGTTDLNLFTTLGFNAIEIVSSPQCAQWGSGALGGILHLKQNAKLQNGFSLKLLKGSFGLWNIASELSLSKKHLSYNLSIGINSQDNNYTFINKYLINPKSDTLKNASLKATNAFQTIAFVKKYFQIALHQWYTKAERGLSNSIIARDGTAKQIDENFRNAINFQYAKGINNISYDFGFYKDYILYNDSYLNLKSETNQSTIQHKLVYQLSKKQMQNSYFRLGYLGQYFNAKVAEYKGVKRDQRHELWTEANFNSHKTNLNVANRWVALNKMVKWVPQLKLTYGFKKGSLAFVSARLYRLPTLNDRFWQPGGNPDIMPEFGWSHEVRFSVQSKNINVNLNIYRNNINNYIQWLPNDVLGFWSPINLKNVTNTGIESQISYHKNINKLKLYSNLNFVYNRSWNRSGSAFTDETKALPYQPRFILRNLTTIQFEQFDIGFTNSLQSMAYVDLLNTAQVKGNYILGISVNKKIKINNYMLNVGMQVNNVLNSYYEIIQYRPMPGRNYILQTTFKL